jgi:FkbM family methyltransferase
MQSADERVTPGYILFDQACSELSSHVTLSLSRTLGGSSLMDPEDHYDNEGCIEIETLSLDEIIESEGIGHVRLLKMDIEGHELPALRGLKKTLQAGLIDY